MIGTLVNDNDEGNSDEDAPKSSVKCPVCLDAIVLATNNNYILLSNFQRHIRIHLKEMGNKKNTTKSKRVGKRKLKSSKVTAVKRKSGRSKSKKANDTEVESTDSDENVEVSKEMNEDFDKETDDINSTDADEAGNA